MTDTRSSGEVEAQVDRDVTRPIELESAPYDPVGVEEVEGLYLIVAADFRSAVLNSLGRAHLGLSSGVNVPPYILLVVQPQYLELVRYTYNNLLRDENYNRALEQFTTHLKGSSLIETFQKNHLLFERVLSVEKDEKKGVH